MCCNLVTLISRLRNSVEKVILRKRKFQEFSAKVRPELMYIM